MDDRVNSDRARQLFGERKGPTAITSDVPTHYSLDVHSPNPFLPAVSLCLHSDHSIHLQTIAKELMPKKAWAYYSSAADDEITNRENHIAYQRFALPVSM
jgi:FMN-dependent dehydrogenase